MKRKMVSFHFRICRSEPKFQKSYFDLVFIGKEDRKKRSGSPPEKPTSAKKKAPDSKKQTGFDRGLEPEKILGKYNADIKLGITLNRY